MHPGCILLQACVPGAITRTIPADGQVFRGLNDNSNVYVRKGNQIYALNLDTQVQTLSSSQIAQYHLNPAYAYYFDSSGNPVQITNGGQVDQAGLQNFTGATGVDFNSLPTYNMGDVNSAFTHIDAGQNYAVQSVSDPHFFATVPPPNAVPQTSYVQNVSPTNPQGAQVVTTGGEVVSDATPLSEVLANAGGTPQQIQDAASQANQGTYVTPNGATITDTGQVVQPAPSPIVPSTPPSSPVYTFNPTLDGNVEIYKDGQRISTGTPQYAAQFGYTGSDANAPVSNYNQPPPQSAPPAPVTPPPVSQPAPIASTSPPAQNELAPTAPPNSIVSEFSSGDLQWIAKLPSQFQETVLNLPASQVTDMKTAGTWFQFQQKVTDAAYANMDATVAQQSADQLSSIVHNNLQNTCMAAGASALALPTTASIAGPVALAACGTDAAIQAGEGNVKGAAIAALGAIPGDSTAARIMSKTTSGLTFAISSKIETQMASRGWSLASITEVLENAFVKSAATNKVTGNSATAYFLKDGSYVVRDNKTGDIIQISNRNDPNWVPDSSIVTPFHP